MRITFSTPGNNPVNFRNRKKFIYLPAFFLFFFFTCGNLFSQGKPIVQGQVKQSDGSPLRNSAVFLYQYNVATKTSTVVDSAYTDAKGNYKFEGAQHYFILAKPDESFPNELPTYYGDAVLTQKAVPVALNFGEAVTADFTTAKKSASNSGTATLGGSIVLAGKTSATPVSKLTVFLADKDKNPVAATSTNASGKFQFKNLAMGNYYVWADFTGVDNTNADMISLNVLNPMKSNLHFNISDGGLNWMDNSYASIKEALPDKENVYALNLKSLQHDVADKSLVINPDDSRTLNQQIGEFVNLESLAIDIDMINFLPSEIGKLGKLTTLTASLNKMMFLPAEMESLKELRVLDLAKNNFSKFPDMIAKYTLLESLNFESNPIPALPPAIGSLKNLKDLNLANCFELLALPPQIGDLTNLETLDLSNCVKLKALPKELNNLKNLKFLDVTGTKLNVSSFKKAVPGCEVRITKK